MFKLNSCLTVLRPAVTILPWNISMKVLHASNLINAPVSVLLFLEAWRLDSSGLEVKGQVKCLWLYRVHCGWGHLQLSFHFAQRISASEAEACRNVKNTGQGLFDIIRAGQPLPADLQRFLEFSPALHLWFWKLVLSWSLDKAEQKNGTLDPSF